MLTAEQAAIERTQLGAVEAHNMPGGWRVIVARRRSGRARTFYHHTDDDPRLPALLEGYAAEYLDTETEDE